MVVEEIALAKIADLVFEKYSKMKEEQEKKITLVKFDSNKFSYTELDDAATQNEEFQKDTPDLIFDNPYKKTCKVKEISLIPDDAFKTKGMVEVYIGDEIFFRNKKFGNFKNLLDSKIPLTGGEPIKPNESVRIFLKSSDGTEIGLAAQVTFGD